jgi:hypothetical protein
VSCRTVSSVPLRRTSALALVALCGCLAWTAPAHAGFVPALGSPFATDSPAGVLALTDAERNGTLDAVTGRLQLLRNDGTGRLRPALRIASPGQLNGIAAGDLTGEGRIDYALVVDGEPDSVVLLAAELNGSYSSSVVEADVGEALEAAVADLDGNGLADIVLTHGGASDELTVLRNQGGSFQRDDYSAGADLAGAVELGDFSGDGRLDVVVGTEGPAVALLVNAGDGTLEPGAAFATGGGTAAASLAVADFDSDGRLDVAAAAGAAVAVLRGDGAGGLAALGLPRPTGVGPPTALAAGDVNGDGPPDVAIGTSAARAMVLLGNGSGGLVGAPGSPVATGAPAGAPVDRIEVADMNRDGQPDLATANGLGSVSVLLNSDTGFLQPLPAGVDFGAMAARSAPQTRTVLLRSARGRVRITRSELLGASGFSVAAGRCVGHTLILGQTCPLTVTFRPPRKAARAQALFSVDANAAAVVIPLTATPRPPVVSDLRLRPKRIQPGRRMTLRYRLSEAARVRVRLQAALPGRRAGRRCVPPRRSNSKRRRCTIWRTVATIVRPAAAGPNLLRPRARAQGPPLAGGRHRVSVSAADRFGNRSREQPAGFRVRPTSR